MGRTHHRQSTKDSAVRQWLAVHAFHTEAGDAGARQPV